MDSKYGYVHIYTGDGKGKTTAAAGLAARMLGRGKSVLFAQLFKYEEESGEIASLKKLGANYMAFSHRHPALNKNYSGKELEQLANECEAFVENVFEIARKDRYDMLVLDEIGPALTCNFIGLEKLMYLINSKPDRTELVLTGRGIPKQIIELADYYTSMGKGKHIYDKGIPAREGIEK
jgi:cob(I)alamin adenosyltransferase